MEYFPAGWRQLEPFNLLYFGEKEKSLLFLCLKLGRFGAHFGFNRCYWKRRRALFTFWCWRWDTQSLNWRIAVPSDEHKKDKIGRQIWHSSPKVSQAPLFVNQPMEIAILITGSLLQSQEEHIKAIMYFPSHLSKERGRGKKALSKSWKHFGDNVVMASACEVRKTASTPGMSNIPNEIRNKIR